MFDIRKLLTVFIMATGLVGSSGVMAMKLTKKEQEAIQKKVDENNKTLLFTAVKVQSTSVELFEEFANKPIQTAQKCGTFVGEIYNGCLQSAMKPLEAAAKNAEEEKKQVVLVQQRLARPIMGLPAGKVTLYAIASQEDSVIFLTNEETGRMLWSDSINATDKSIAGFWCPATNLDTLYAKGRFLNFVKNAATLNDVVDANVVRVVYYLGSSKPEGIMFVKRNDGNDALAKVEANLKKYHFEMGYERTRKALSEANGKPLGLIEDFANVAKSGNKALLDK